MAQIAIIGTQGAGKTVFLSVLAMRYRRPQVGLPWLEWKNRETQLYVSEAWDTLARQEWPASTQSNKDRIFPMLEWALHAGLGQSHPLRVIDSIGQDIRAIFESKQAEWNEAQSKVRQEFDRADVVLFLVNLREVIDAASQGKIDDIEIPIKLAIESAAQRGACFALLLSQHDSFADHLARVGIGQNDPLDALRHFLPQLAGFLGTVRDDRVKAYYLAAVAETVAMPDANGTMQRRPKQDFKSEGLDELMEWLSVSLSEAKAVELRRAALLKKQEAEALEASIKVAKRNAFRWAFACFVLAALVLGISGITYVYCSVPTEVDIIQSVPTEADIIQSVPTKEEHEHQVNKVSLIDPNWYDAHKVDSVLDSRDDVVFINKTGYDFQQFHLDVVASDGHSIRLTTDSGMVRAYQPVTFSYEYNFKYIEPKYSAYCFQTVTEPYSVPIAQEKVSNAIKQKMESRQNTIKEKMESRQNTIKEKFQGAIYVSLIISFVVAVIVFSYKSRKVTTLERGRIAREDAIV